MPKVLPKKMKVKAQKLYLEGKTINEVYEELIKTYPKENMQLLLDAGYTESEIKKMNPNKRIGLKDSIKSYRKVLIPHLKKYDGTIESLVVDDKSTVSI